MYYIPKGGKPAPTPPQNPEPEPVAPDDVPPPDEPERPPENVDDPPPGDDTPGDDTPGDDTDKPPPKNDKPGDVKPPPKNDKPGDVTPNGDEPGDVTPNDDTPPNDQGNNENTDKPPAKTCAVTSMVLSKKGLAYKPKATKPNTPVWFSVIPEAKDAWSLSFDSDKWTTPSKVKSDWKEAAEKFNDYAKDPAAAKKKWKSDAVEKAKNSFALKITVVDTLPSDSAEVLIAGVHACDMAIERHKLSSSASGLSPNDGLAPATAANNWTLKAKGPTKRGKDAEPRVYTVQLPACEPSKDSLLGKVCVFPARKESIEFTFKAKKFNELAKKISNKLSIFGDRLKFECEIGTLFLGGTQGWFEQDDGKMAYQREVSGGMNPIVKVEAQLKISALECVSGIPQECWEYVCDIGCYFKIGGSLGFTLKYVNRYFYSTKKTQHEIGGELEGKIWAGIGLYAKAGPKGLAQVSVEAGAKFGLTAKGGVKYVSGEDIGADASLSIDPVKLEVVIKTEFLWVFGSEHPTEWDLTDKFTIWEDKWTLMKFNQAA